jgi:hypothetical protein
VTASSCRPLFSLVALALAACATGSSNTLAGAAVTTAAGAGAAALSRANGGCIAMCTNGTICNPRTGLCEVLPCRGQCGASEHCEQTFTDTKCVPGPETGVTSVARGSSTKGPILAPVNTATDTSGPPIVVPKAEEQPK